MKFKLSKITWRLRNYSKSIVFEGIGLTLILVFMALLLLINVIRVIDNSKYNYETYLQEKKSLDEIAQKNDELKQESEYVNSDEYKLLLAREILNMGSANENIFKTKQEAVFFDEKKVYLDVGKKDNYTSWWSTLVPFK